MPRPTKKAAAAVATIMAGSTVMDLQSAVCLTLPASATDYALSEGTLTHAPRALAEATAEESFSMAQARPRVGIRAAWAYLAHIGGIKLGAVKGIAPRPEEFLR